MRLCPRATSRLAMAPLQKRAEARVACSAEVKSPIRGIIQVLARIMIVVCPGCTAHYGIDREAFGLNARLVRCSACDYEWEAAPGELEASDLDAAAARLPAAGAGV